MRRSGFVFGVAVGGLVGVAVGYLISRDGHIEAESPMGSIDLTPTMEAEISAPPAGDAPRPARARRKEAAEPEE